MKKLTFILVFLSSLLFSQTISFNLKNLNEVKIEIDDPLFLISPATKSNLIDNVKIKLAGVGIKENEKSSATLQMKLFAIKSGGLVNDRVWLSIRIIENAKIKRGSTLINSEVLSYQNNSFQIVENVNYEKTCSDIFLNSLILEFLTSWLNDNK